MIKRFLKDDSAVSVSVGSILIFSISVLAFIMVMNSFFSMMDQTEETVTREEFETYGNDMALQLTNVDTIISNTGKSGVNSLKYEFTIPDKVAGEYYSVNFSNKSNEITFESQNQVKVKVPYSVCNTQVETTTIYSSSTNHYFFYNSSKNLIEVH
ncbi:hypothetical protein Metev_0479 [Methanohalobium evestigatum Z-7303]|uniref:Flagellin n=1 Tax=Methanohalobium evestigatum (strain ATCC BAA-1072 / DSM 3721 / NBRC 107634 / OCM 161 / Z-7303) TaxID=644295 RepID=D7E851_METEZ|nr:hypothetical protein [Methanohalobium evestigatum]ADI73393.1 hypothetical protein Metev_0479 [Methanohalobium evestigatum Z-7303]